MSRFQVHDELTAPKASLPVLTGALKASGGQLPNLLAVLAGCPAVLRAYARWRSELRDGTLPPATRERIALAVAQHYGSDPDLDLHRRTARRAGVGVDEVARALTWSSSDAREVAMLAYLRSVLEQRGKVPLHLHEEAREAGWTDAQLLEGIAQLCGDSFTALVNVAGEIPIDGSHEQDRALRAA